MKPPRRLLRDWTRRVVRPRIPEAELNAKLLEVRRHVPAPVFWLLGKAQSGKTSIVRTLTGSTAAEVGNGFQPCTRSAHFFDFPAGEAASIRFLDTRGLAEVAYDPAEDMRWCGQQAHLLLVVMKAMDHQQDSVVQAVRAIHAAHPEWPLIVAQTALHEGYPRHGSEHILPYPYAEQPFAAGVPDDLARSLLKQREWFAGLNAHFVPLDFTLDEDGYDPVDYGIEALWDAIEATLPLGLRLLFGQCEQRRLLDDAYARQARPHIISYALAAGLAEALPVPAASIATAAALQAKLFQSIASVYGLKLTPKTLAEIGGAVGIGIMAGMCGRELAKLVPGYGQTIALGVAGLYTASVTYALGQVFCSYFAGTLRGHAFSAPALRALYREELQHGRALLTGPLRRAAVDG
ncbi:MAG: GTPase family protein [Candidatus Methylumidiphilus sp.]